MRFSAQRLLNAFLSLSVSKKTILGTSFSIVVALSLFTIISLSVEWRSFRNSTVDQLESFARIVSSNSEAALSFNDPFTATEYLNALSDEPDITYAVLYDASGDEFASYIRTDETTTPPFSAPNFTGARLEPDNIKYVSPVTIDGEILGTLLIETNMRSIKTKQMTSLVIAAIMLLGGLALAAIIAYRIQSFITRPLSELTDLIRNVTENRNYSIKAQKRYNDEIGTLVEGFNFMLKSIHQQNIEIKDHNKTLEEQVAERTRDLKAAMVQAESALRAKSEFLSTMSHELRTPMNAIVGISSMLISSNVDDETKGHLEIVKNSSDTLLCLINDVLDYSKIESGKLELEEQDFEIRNNLESAMDLVAAQSRNTDKIFITSIDPRLPRSMSGDVNRIRQIIINLLSNAAKFTKEGHILLQADLISTSKIRFSVTDTGIGIPPDRLDRLFKSFSQVDSSTTRKYGGTGLGLAISQKLTRAMGGKISVRSEFRKGSTFSFELPLGAAGIIGIETINDFTPVPVKLIGFDKTLESSLRQSIVGIQSNPDYQPIAAKIEIHSAINTSAEEAIKYIETEKKNSSAIGVRAFICHPKHATTVRKVTNERIIALPVRISDIQKTIELQTDNVPQSKAATADKSDSIVPSPLRILLVEDNKINQKVFNIIMEREGYRADIANNGQEAFETVMTKQYDIVFMDLQMPVMGGIDSCMLIRSVSNEIHQPWIIGFTANAEANAESDMRAAGMDDFLQKPVRNTDLRQKIQKYQENIRLRN